mgnify:FL=1
MAPEPGQAKTPGTPVTVRLYAAARSAAGRDELTMSPGALHDVLTTATTQLPSGFAAMLESCSVLVDGLAVDADVEPEYPVAPGSTIDILPPFAGG